MDSTDNTIDEARMEQELQHLLEKARDAARASSATAPDRPHRRRGGGASILLFAAPLVMAAAAAGWLVLDRPSAGIRPTAAAVISEAGHRIVQTIGDTVARLIDGGAAAQAGDAQQGAKASAPGKHARRSRAAPKADAPPVAAGVPAAPALPSALPPPATAVLVVPSDVLQMDAVPDAEPGPLYTAKDDEVVPPVPLPPLVGRVVARGEPMPGDADVIVAPSGAVERVSLLSPNQFEGRMLVAAIKNQQFRPALAHGRPVRYLLRLRVPS